MNIVATGWVGRLCVSICWGYLFFLVCRYYFVGYIGMWDHYPSSIKISIWKGINRGMILQEVNVIFAEAL